MESSEQYSTNKLVFVRFHTMTLQLLPLVSKLFHHLMGGYQGQWGGFLSSVPCDLLVFYVSPFPLCPPTVAQRLGYH